MSKIYNLINNDMNEEHKIPKIISDIGNENPYSVPETYFDDLQNRINKKLDKNDASKPKVAFFDYAKPYIAVAASITIIFAIWFLFFNTGLNTNRQSANSLIKNDDSSQMYYAMNENEIIEHITNDESQPAEIETLSNDVIVDYLDSHVDIYSLNE